MNAKALVSALVTVSGLTFCTGVFALDFPAPSPACTLKQRVGLTDIEIIYSRPGMKGRPIFGGLIPYGEVWRTGANQATKIAFSTPVKLNGAEIPAGQYALYTIPDKQEWTVILSKDTTASIFDYNPTNDLVRLKATPVKLADPVETFTLGLNDIRDDSATLNLDWEQTRVPVKLELDLTGKLVPQIEAVMAGPGGQKPYYQAAMFYFYHGQDLKKASQWIDAALAQREAHYMVYLKAQILAKLGDKPGAIAAAKRSAELALKANDKGYVKLNEDLISSLR